MSMTRKTRRELERDVAELTPDEADPGPLLVHENSDGEWYDARDGTVYDKDVIDPVAVIPDSIEGCADVA